MCVVYLNLPQYRVSYQNARCRLSNKPVAVQNVYGGPIQGVWMYCRRKDRVFGQYNETCSERSAVSCALGDVDLEEGEGEASHL